jgi:rod shape-determining protein MreC
MPSLSPARQNALLLVVLLFAQLLLMTGNVRRSDGATLLEKGALRVSGPVVGASHVVGGGMGGVVDALRDIRNARRENVLLRGEIGRLRAEVDRRQEQALQNDRLRRLLDMKEFLVPRSVGAAVVTASLSNQEHVIVIDRGTDDGVRPDRAVLAWGGAVGRVILADRRWAKVRLLSDPNSGAAGIVQRSRQQGMVLGRGGGVLEMAYVPGFADVALGDRVVTSGIDGVFPRGIGIGVVRASEPSGVARTILIAPEVDYGGLEEVLVLLDSGQEAPPLWVEEGES